MIDPRFRDFDAFFAERQGRGPKLKLFGETHHLPPSVSAEFVLAWHVSMVNKPAGSVVTDAQLIKLFKSLFGNPLGEKLINRGLTIDQVVELLRWGMEAYGIIPAAPSSDVAADPKPTPAPRRKRRRR